MTDGRELKEQGMGLAREAVGEDWRQRFADEVQRLADLGYYFTSEDVLDEVGLPNDSGANANNSVGAMMSAMARRGVIRKTGKYIPSRRAVSHYRELAEWVGVQWT